PAHRLDRRRAARGRPAPAPRLPRRPPQRAQRRPAAQPRQDGDRRVTKPAGRVACALALAAAAALIGCGGGDAAPPARAALAPPGAPLYAQAVVRPQGDQADLMKASFSKLLNTDNPGGFITSRLNGSLAAKKLSYSKDVEPWLGENAGIFY